jgi:hypothetical protein
MNELVIIPSICYAYPAIVAAAGNSAQLRFLEFFTANIRNPHTRRAQATREFLTWCETAGASSVTAVAPVRVAAYIEQVSRERSAPTAKQRLAANQALHRARPQKPAPFPSRARQRRRPSVSPPLQRGR